MSTKSTIKWADRWHLYEEMSDEYPDNIRLDLSRRDYDGTILVDSVRIPWEAATAICHVVSKRLQEEQNLRDPAWLQTQIKEHQDELAEMVEAGLSGFMDKIFFEGTKERLEEYQKRLRNIDLKEPSED